MFIVSTKIKSAPAALVAALSDEDQGVRSWTVLVLGEVRDPKTVPVLVAAGRFDGIDALVPLPLHPAKERKRGYNQAEILCRGMAQVLELPVITGAVIRRKDAASQTHKTRVERWQSMEEQFQLAQPAIVAGRHLLLVDDVSSLHILANGSWRSQTSE